MNYNTQNAKIASITEKTLVVGIDVGSEIHYARAFDWRNYEYSKKPFAFNNDEAGFTAFKAWMEDMADKHGKEAVIPGMEPTGHYWLNLGAYLQEQGMRPVPSMFYLLSSSFFHRRFSAYIQKDKSSENLPLPTTVLLLIYVSACSLLTRTY